MNDALSIDYTDRLSESDNLTTGFTGVEKVENPEKIDDSNLVNIVEEELSIDDFEGNPEILKDPHFSNRQKIGLLRKLSFLSHLNDDPTKRSCLKNSSYSPGSDAFAGLNNQNEIDKIIAEEDDEQLEDYKNMNEEKKKKIRASYIGNLMINEASEAKDKKVDISVKKFVKEKLSENVNNVPERKFLYGTLID